MSNICGSGLGISNMNQSIEKEERVRIGKLNISVSMLQGPSNHAIWKARLLAALNAEDKDLFSVATGEWKLNDGSKVLNMHHHKDQESDDQKETKEGREGGNGKEEDDEDEDDEDEEKKEEKRLQCKRAHERCIPLITSTLPDSIFAMVMNHASDAFKLMETIDARFKPYPRYSALQD